MNPGPHEDQDITQLLNAWKNGNSHASEALFDKIYPVLRKIAAPILAGQGSDLTLDTTDVLHEAFLKIVDQKKADWTCKTHFYAVAAQMVRRIIIDHARHRGRKKRGGDVVKVPLQMDGEASLDFHEDWLALDEALAELSAMHPQAAKVVELRYFAGMNNEEIATALDVGTATVVRHWRFARAVLKQALSPDSD